MGNTQSYVWEHKDRDTFLYDTEVDGEEALCKLDSLEEAEQLLERKIENDPDKDYDKFSLFKYNNGSRYKVMDAVEVRTEQADIFSYND